MAALFSKKRKGSRDEIEVQRYEDMVVWVDCVEPRSQYLSFRRGCSHWVSAIFTPRSHLISSSLLSLAIRPDAIPSAAKVLTLGRDRQSRTHLSSKRDNDGERY